MFQRNNSTLNSSVLNNSTLNNSIMNNSQMEMSRNSSIDGRRRSLSKGKGLTVLMSMNNVLNTTLDSINLPKPRKLVNND